MFRGQRLHAEGSADPRRVGLTRPDLEDAARTSLRATWVAQPGMIPPPPSPRQLSTHEDERGAQRHKSGRGGGGMGSPQGVTHGGSGWSSRKHKALPQQS